jgi:predicted transcriptional regulator
VAVFDRRADRYEPLTTSEVAAERDANRRPVYERLRTLRIALHHVDLPKLAAIGVVEYDRDGRAAAPTDRLSTSLDRLALDV